MKLLIALCLSVAVTSLTPSLADPADWTTGPFDMPESAIYDPIHDRIVLSVMGGDPGAADGDGTLALLSPDGAVLDRAWVAGLDAPKGMAIVGTTLLVADLTRLHEIDLATGTVMRSLDLEGAVFLNDVTSDGTRAFVSDLMANRIWLYTDGLALPWLQNDRLAHPNGLLLEEDRLLVGSWGEGLRADFSTEMPGALLAVDLSDREITVLADAVGNLDGIVRLNGALLVNDWITGALFRIEADGTAHVIAEHAPGLADIGAYEDMLLLPAMLDGTLSAQTVP
ncbi:hypothetical protein V8J82_21340 [Gymnodinialimonas sp. 2305UL16-5]|uniref:hypothetical protein n=1 Tax=Gymnodinialimonas mytili TaxID=3126503 RepID=UPI0030A05856